MYTEKLISELKQYKDKLDEYKNFINSNAEKLKEYFFQNRRNWECCDEEGKEIPCTDVGFGKLLLWDSNYIEKQKKFIEEILALDFVKENKFNRQIKTLLRELVNDVQNEVNSVIGDNLIFEMKYKSDFMQTYKSVFLLAKFAGIENNIILIGGNGSGKSSLANALKGNDTENICVIPAQKSLYFSMNDMSMLSTRKRDVVNLLLENNIYKSKVRDDYGYYQFQNNQFTKLIVAMKEQYFAYLMECDKKRELAKREASIYGQLQRIYSIIFPEIELEFEGEVTEFLDCRKGGEKYHVNALSEGEKAVIYYAVSVLMAKKDSFIVVDEPETYLNPSLTNLLWDQLIRERSDCQFIFITHSVDFVLGRSDSKVAWIKNFQYPDHWEFEFIDDDFSLPKMLMTEILGSKKPVAFCEGNDKSSLDYKVYRSLLGESYTVIPVGGHGAVIKNCEVLLTSPWLGLDAFGIVDGDHYTKEKIEALKAKRVKVLPFNEIEMLLLSEEVMEYTMHAAYPVDYKDKIAEFKKAFFDIVQTEKEKIALNNTALNVNDFLSKEKIQDHKNIESITENLTKIAGYDVKQIYTEKVKEIEAIVATNNYGELLRICNLKAEISKGLADRKLDGNYITKAIQQIQTNEELKATMRKKYFSLE